MFVEIVVNHIVVLIKIGNDQFLLKPYVWNSRFLFHFNLLKQPLPAHIDHLLKVPVSFQEIVILKIESRGGSAYEGSDWARDRLADTESVIWVSRIDDRIQKIQDALNEATAPAILFSKENSGYFLWDLTEILGDRTEPKSFAHAQWCLRGQVETPYELEELLPRYFCRISKSTIANARAIYSLEKSFGYQFRPVFWDT